MHGTSYVPVASFVAGAASVWLALSSARGGSIDVRIFAGPSTYTREWEPIRFGCAILCYLAFGVGMAFVGLYDLWMSARIETWVLGAITALALLALWRAIAEGRPRAADFLPPFTAALRRRDLAGAGELATPSGGAVPRVVRAALCGVARPQRGGAYRTDREGGAKQVRARLPDLIRHERARAAVSAAIACGCAVLGASLVLARQQARSPWSISFCVAAAAAALATVLAVRSTWRELATTGDELLGALDGGEPDA